MSKGEYYDLHRIELYMFMCVKWASFAQHSLLRGDYSGDVRQGAR